MDNKPLESKLTPAAKEVLLEMVEDYKLQLLKESNKNASDITGEVREISVRDLLETIQKLESPRANKKTLVIERVLILYTFVGILTTLISILFSRYETSQIIDLIGFIGSVMALVSFLLYFINAKRSIKIGSLIVSKRDTSFENKDYSMLFILMWREIETLSKEVIAYYIGESNVDNISIRELLKYLQKFKVFDSLDSKLFLRLLDKRNSVVHSRSIEISVVEYKELEDYSNTILKKLHIAKETVLNQP